MKTSTLKNISTSILTSLGIFSIFTPPDKYPETFVFSVAPGINLLGVVLIGAILYLGYYTRNRYEERHKTRNEKS